MTSLFDAPNNLVDPTPQTPDEGKNYVEELVGEGKKFKTVEDLARGKWEADQYIEHLKKQMDAMREDLTKRLTVEEMLEKIKASQSPPAKTDDNHQIEQLTTQEIAPKISPDEIKQLIKQTLTEEQRREIAARNVETVQQELIKQWGSSYSSKLTQAIAELGLTKEQAAEMAETSPKAFLRLVGADQPAKQQELFSAPPQNSVVVRNDNSGGAVKNYKYYSEMRKNDPARYWSVQVQKEMHKMAQELGDRFYQ